MVVAMAGCGGCSALFELDLPLDFLPLFWDWSVNLASLVVRFKDGVDFRPDLRP
jgi:hypothetical protein